MLPRLLAAAVLALGTVSAQSQVDPNLQNLLTGLTSGAEVMLVTLVNGMQQVTSFRPGTRLSSVDANAMIERARGELRVYGELQPSVAATLQGGSAAAGGTTVRNTSDSPFGRGISDTPPTLVPGVTTGPTAPMTTGTAPLTPAPFGAR